MVFGNLCSRLCDSHKQSNSTQSYKAVCPFPPQATFFALQNTYDFLTPDMWTPTRFEKQPIQEFTDFLARPVIGDAPKAYAY